MPRKHTKDRKGDHSGDRGRHDRRDRDSDRDRRDHRGRDDRGRDRSRERNFSSQSQGRDRHDNRGSSDNRGSRGYDNNNSGSNNNRGRPDQRFQRGNHNNGGGGGGGGSSHPYGFAPPMRLPMGAPPPVFLPFGGHGMLPIGIMPPMIGGFGPPSLMGMPPPPFPPMVPMRDDRREDDRGRKREYSRGRDQGREGWDNKRPRMDSRDRDFQEQQRLTVSQYAPDRIFIEDVDLQPEFAFRLDTAGNSRHLKYSSLNLTNTSRIDPSFRRDDIFGASEEELSRIPFRSVFSRCVRPVGIDDEGNPVDDDGNLLDEDGKAMILTPDEKVKTLESLRKKAPGKRKHAPLKAVSFFSFDKNQASSSGSKASDAPRKVPLDINKKSVNFRDQVEAYNVDLRKNPRDIELWRKFVKFQDQVFQHEAEELLHNSEEAKKSKQKKQRNKLLAEKKISILDKALEANPKNLDLHLDRLELVYEIYKPRYVLGEWRKLTTVYQQLDAFWNEYLRFGTTQLQLYSTSAAISTFEKCFQKFRLMLNPNYPSFQRPEKFLLFISDMLLGLALALRDGGFSEKAISLFQAQLEINFNFPEDLIPDKGKAEWEKVCKLFELFWDAGTQRFGEPEAPGWANFVQNKPGIPKTVLGLSEKSLSDWEFKFFESLNSREKGSEEALPRSKHWLTVESFRSTLNWLPWRESCSDAESCEDNQRIVLANELTPFLINIPDESNFERSSAQFRTAVNFLLLLQEDFLPRTQVLDSLLSSFPTVSLANSKTFFSEVYYWKTLLNLYMPSGTNEDIIIPDGFDLVDYSNRSGVECLARPPAAAVQEEAAKSEADGPASPEENPPPKKKTEYPEEIMEEQKELYKNNVKFYQGLVRRVVEKSVESLPSKFASLLAQLYIKYVQRDTYQNVTGESPKSRMKSAKELLQNEKLRNSVPLYGEMALLEYFCSKNKVKASAILVKAINSSVQVFQKDENFDVLSQWETLAEITRMYKLLAELQLSQDHNISLHVLAALGSNFKDVRVEGEFGELSKNELLLARRQFEKVLNTLLSFDSEDLLLQFDGDKSVEFMVQNTHLLVEWTSVFGLFLYLSTDYAEASDLFRKVLKKVSGQEALNKSNKYKSDVVNGSHIREQLFIMWCKIGILETAKNPMQHSKFRQVLVDALTEFPASPPLLVIFTDVEKQSSIAGKIWRAMTGSIKKESSINSLHWAPLFMALGLARKVDELRHDEEVGLPTFGLGGPAVPPDTIFHKLDAVLETAEQNPCTRNCPLIWRIHLRLNALRILQSKFNSEQITKGVFYDAIRHCPAVKYMYMDGLQYFPDMLKEIQDLMSEKQFYVRLPLEELNLQLENEEEEEGNNEDEDEDEEEHEKISSKSEGSEDDDDIQEIPPVVDIEDSGPEESDNKKEPRASSNNGDSKQEVYDIESMSEGEIAEDEDNNS